jgi:glycosyltransferase involved in cell wall biosynthesis
MASSAGLGCRLSPSLAGLTLHAMAHGTHTTTRGPTTRDRTGSSESRAGGPLPISLVVITRDAAADIADCLLSAPFASDALVVDSGSADHTVEVARRTGARVITRPFLGFGRQKQFAVEEAKHDWVLCLDADERLSPALRASIADLFASGNPPHAAYALARRNRFLGRWLSHGEGYPDWTTRLFDRRRARWSDDPVHERVIAKGPVGRLEGDLLHASAESLERYIAKQNRYTTLQADALHASGRRSSAFAMALSPLARFLRFYVLRLGFLDGAPGFAHIAIGAFASFLKHAKLRALERAQRGS